MKQVRERGGISPAAFAGTKRPVLNATRAETTARRRAVPSASVRSEELAAEQGYLDCALTMHRRSLAEAARAKENAGGSAADRRAVAKSLDGVGWIENVDGRRFYVGKVSIMGEDKSQLVASWKSPLGERFYSAVPGGDSGLSRKRQFTMDRNTLRSYSDQWLSKDLEERPLPESGGSIRRAGAPKSPAGTEGGTSVDDALLREMEKSRQAEMRDIVGTIQADQYSILAHDPDRVLLVQGGPGTGKTAVILHRISWLLFNQKDLRPEDVLVVSPNSTLSAYVKHVLPALGDEGVRHIAVNDVAKGFQAGKRKEYRSVTRLKSDARMAKVLEKGLRQRIGVISGGVNVTFAGSNRKAILGQERVRELADGTRAFPYLVGRRTFAQRLEQELIAAYPPRRRMTFAESFSQQSFNQQVDRVWPTFSPQQFLRELFASKRKLAEASAGILTEAETALLVREQAPSMGDEPWTEADSLLLHEVQVLLDPTAVDRFSHIVVDEAQDLNGMQIQALKRSSRSGAITLAGDIAQSTGPNRRDTWDEVTGGLISASPGMTWTRAEADRRTLKFVYRVPREVQRLANALQHEVAPDLDSPLSVRSSGYDPRTLASSASVIGSVLIEAVLRHRAESRMVGIIAPRNHFSAVKAALKAQGIDYVFAHSGQLSPSVTVATPEEAKGLEFDAVVIVDPGQIHAGGEGARELYIALTRTTECLDLLIVDRQVPPALEPYVELPPVPAEPGPEALNRAGEVTPHEEAAGRLSGADRSADASGKVVSVETSTEDEADDLHTPASESAETPGAAEGEETVEGDTDSAGGSTAQAVSDSGVTRRFNGINEQFVQMVAELHLSTLRGLVHPDLVEEVIRRMEVLAKGGGQ